MIVHFSGMRSSISTHALTEGDCNLLQIFVHLEISTHALTEGDYFRFSQQI